MNTLFMTLLVLTFVDSSFAALPKNIDSFFNDSHPSCFLLKKINEPKIYSYNEKQCRVRVEPFSTFKILNSLIALETGVVDSKTVIPWDKKKKFLKVWEKDHNLKSAIKYSVVPFYQEIARRIGKERMNKYVQLAKYGNTNIGNRIDRFWLDGPIKISAFEQLEFIERLYLNNLPFKKKNQQFVRDIIIQSNINNRILSGKTGSRFRDGSFNFGWFVGHIKKGKDQYVFVINSKGKGEAGHKLKKIAEKVLQEMNI